MSVLEICQLRVKPTIYPTDPAILKSLVEVRSSLASRVQKTNSQFYQCIEAPTLIYILGVWPSLSSHHDFLSSPEKENILEPQVDLLDYGWMMHIPLSSMEELPLEAHVMGIERFWVKEGGKGKFEKVLEGQRKMILEAKGMGKTVEGWKCDGEAGKEEAVVFSGWESKEAHEELMVKAMGDPDYASLVSSCDEIEVRTLRNMEAR